MIVIVVSHSQDVKYRYYQILTDITDTNTNLCFCFESITR